MDWAGRIRLGENRLVPSTVARKTVLSAFALSVLLSPSTARAPGPGGDHSIGATASRASARGPRFLRLPEVRELIAGFSASDPLDLPAADLSGEQAWDRWVRRQDQEIRQRIARG